MYLSIVNSRDSKLIGVIPFENNPAAALTPQIRIVENWLDELKLRVPVQ
jgi:hypothetical protein